MRSPAVRRRPRLRRSRVTSSADGSGVLVEGPWVHRDVLANGFSFHLAVGLHHDARRGPIDRVPLVLLLHGFLQFWWAWRHQLPALDLAGHPVAAMDLRGHGASDQPPHGYDPATLARDVVGVVRGLGHDRAVIVGHDLGGSVGWATAAFAPDVLSGLVTVATPAPGARRLPDVLAWLPAWTWSRRDGRRVADHLRASTAGPDGLDPGALDRYRRALLAWPAPQRAVAPGRHPERDVRRALARRPAAIDLLTVRGEVDPVLGRTAVEQSARLVTGRHDHVELPGVGHLVPEEDPDRLTDVLLDWLARAPVVPPAS